MSKTKTIPPLDLMWLLMETQAAPTHVGAMMLFEKPRGRPGTVREIVEFYRSFEPTPPFNYIPELAGAHAPYFREVDHWDPLYHIQFLALPSGSSYEDFLRLIADLHEPMLDRSRPLFRLWVIDDVPGGRFAVYTKVHHSIIDGASGSQRMYASLSLRARDPIRPPAFAVRTPVRKPRPPKALAERLAALGTTAGKQTLALSDVWLGALRKTFTALTGSDPGGSQPFTAHPAPMNEPMKMARTYATLSLPLEEMQKVGHHFGATLNDLAITIVDEGVHRYLRQTGRAFPQRLVAFCPMSLRDEGDTEAKTKASAMFVHLGQPDSAVDDRIREVTAQMAVAKKELRAMSKDAAMAYAVAVLGLAELRAAPGIAQVTRPLANLVISNVPGGKETMYSNGARLVGTFPVSAVAASIGLNATLTSDSGRMDFGFVGNGATMYQLPDLARHVADAYQELKAAAGMSRGRAGDAAGRGTAGRAARPRPRPRPKASRTSRGRK